MRLIVTERQDMDVSFDTVVISPAEFNCPKCHLYIISNEFDDVVVELSDKVSLGKIRPLMSRVRVTPKVPEQVNSHTISLLCEMYPDKSAELRYTMIREPGKISSVIESMGRELHWSEHY